MHLFFKNFSKREPNGKEIHRIYESIKEGKKKREEVRMKKETFCRYIRQYETDMFRFAKSIVGNQADGEDAMQESILKAYEKIDTLKSTRKFKAWIFQILANECYQILRNRKRQEPTDPFEFPKQHQEVLILYYYDEFSTKEIGSREKKCRNRCRNQPEKGWMIC